MDLFTANVNEQVTITADDNIYKMSVAAYGGTITIEGNLTKFAFESGLTLVSSPVTLTEGQAMIFTPNPNSGAKAIITPGTGTINLAIFQG